MDYPILKTIPARYETLDVFGGYNGSPRVADGEFADMKNMTSDHFLSDRRHASRSPYPGF